MDIAELGYKVDSSGLTEGTKALDQNAAAADRAGGAAERLEKDYQSMSRAIEQSSRVLGDRLGGALDRIGAGTGATVAELQSLNRAQTEILAALSLLQRKAGGASDALTAVAESTKGATAALSSAATASQQLEQELAQSEARYRNVAQRAVEYAESMRGANLSERALAEAARDAAAGVDMRAQAMARAGSEQERMAMRARALQEAEARTKNQALEAARAVETQQLNLKGLLGQIDPTVAALNRLADMEDRLERAAGLGLIKPQVVQQYQAQLDATRQKTLAASRETDGLTGSFGRLNIESAETQRNLSQLVGYLATGNFGMAGNQVMQLGNQAGIAARLFSGAGLAVGGFTAALVAGVAAWKQGQDELFDFQKALVLTGRNADVGSAQFQRLVSEIDKLSGVSRGEAVDALNAVASSGQFAGKQFTMVAEAAARMEASTGQASSKTVAAFERIARDPVNALVELNRAEGFLSVAQLQRVATLQQEGHEQDAVTEALRLYHARAIDVADQADALMPGMVHWWREVKGEVSGAWGEVQIYASLLDRVITRQQIASKFNLGEALNRLGANTGSLASLIPKGWLSSGATLTNALAKSFLGEAGGRSQGADSTFEVAVDGRKSIEDYNKVLKDNEVAEKAASEALNSRLAGLDRAASKQQALNKIIELYNKLPANDERHFDGSMQRLIAQANAQVDKQFNRREGLNKPNADDNSAQSFIANVQRQITANEQLAASGDKVTTSDRLVIQAKQLLADKTNTMTAATRALLQTLIPTLETTDAQAQAEVQRQRGMQASIALTERLTQLEKQRQEQADVDLMGIGRGADATEMLQRQLDIQRQYLREQEKLDKAYNTERLALSGEALRVRQAQYDEDTAKLQGSLDTSLSIERAYQARRAAMLGDWRTGVNRAWEDYVASAANASGQAASALTNGLSAAEDAFVRFVQTGKLSFTTLADSIIADLARIAAKQAAVGIFNAISSAWGGGPAMSSTYSAQSFGNNTGWLNEGVSFGGGRASGGPVSRSSLYEVGEQGRPELFSDARGKTYLIPGSDGRVVPMAPNAAGGSVAMAAPQITIQVNVDASGNAEAQTTGDAEGGARQLAQVIKGQVTETLLKEMRPGGLLTRGRVPA